MRVRIEREERPTGSRHWLRVRESAKPDIDIFFDFVGEHEMPLPQVADGPLLAVLHRAMHSGEEIWIDGAVTREALQNLGEYQDAMHAFYPDQCRRVSINANGVVDLTKREKSVGAISCFSGGVDSSFSLLRHSQLKDESALPIRAALIIHQLRKDHEDEHKFSRLVDRVRPLCDELGVRLHVARTNLRQVTGHEYLHNFGAQLASALHNYSAHYQYGIIPSSEPYVALILPFGSSPVTDHLLSGGAMKIVHDGAGFSRTEKVASLITCPAALKTLHVCQKHPYENCGNCMKCVRTRMNLLAVGTTDIDAFPEPFRPELIEELRLNLPYAVSELRSLLAYASRNGINAEWTRRLRDHLDAGEAQLKPSAAPKQPSWITKLRRRLHKATKRTDSKLGMKQLIGRANPESSQRTDHSAEP